MLVSILTPSYNQDRWLRDNLKSVANQTYTNIEHIVSDGGSTDTSVDILRSASHNLDWVSEPDRGQSHALNKAFQKSSGDIIGWINSDDAYVDERAVEEAVKIFEKYPDVGVVYGHGLLVSENNRILQAVWVPPYSSRLLRRQTFFVQPSVFIRRSCLGMGLVREDLDYVMDRDLWIRLRSKTRFRRLNLVVGMDRNQAARKSLQEQMSAETREYDGELGIDHTSRLGGLGRKLVKIGLRWSGLGLSWRLPRILHPAIDLQYPSLWTRVRYQTLTPRSKML